MIRSHSRVRLAALSVGVALVAGCASPVGMAPATGPGFVGDPGASPPGGGANALGNPATPGAAIVTPPTQGSGLGAAPAQPAAPTVNGRDLDLVATFDGEPQVGFAVAVLDAATGEPIAKVADLARARGLAVLDQGLVTDRAGAVHVRLAGLAEGDAVRIVFTKGAATLETVVTGTGETLAGGGAPSALTLLASEAISVDAATTTAAKMARGVLVTCRLLPAARAAKVIAAYMKRMAALTKRLETTFQADRDAALRVIQARTEDDASGAVFAAIKKLGALEEAMQAVAEAVQTVAKEAGPDAAAGADPKVKAALEDLTFVGTPLVGAFEAGLRLSNKFGGSVDAATGDVGSIASRTSRPSSGGGNRDAEQVESDDEPDDGAREVATYAALVEAIDAGDDVSLIRLTADLVADGDYADHALVVGREVVIDGDGFGISGLASAKVQNGAELKDFTSIDAPITLDGGDATLRGFEDQAYGVRVTADAGTVLIDGCSFSVTDVSVYLTITGAADATVSDCTFGVDDDMDTDAIGVRVRDDGAQAGVAVDGCTFINLGIGVDTNVTSLATTFEVTGCTFDVADAGVSGTFNLFGRTADSEPTFSGNAFNGGAYALHLYSDLCDDESVGDWIDANFTSDALDNIIDDAVDVPAEVEQFSCT